MEAGRLVRVELHGASWLEIQRQIRAVLNADWDPIGAADHVDDEYDDYIADLQELLARRADVEAISG